MLYVIRRSGHLRTVLLSGIVDRARLERVHSTLTSPSPASIRGDASIMRSMSLHSRLVCRLGLVGVLLLAPVEASERFTATVGVLTASGGATTSLTIVIDKFSSESERASLIKSLKENNTAAHDLLARRPTVGSLQIGTRSTPIKYAYAVSIDGRRQITVVTGSPIVLDNAGGATPATQPGFDVGLVLLDMPPSGPGAGDMVPATKIRVEQDNTIVTEHASPDLVRLSNVTVRK